MVSMCFFLSHGTDSLFSQELFVDIVHEFRIRFLQAHGSDNSLLQLQKLSRTTVCLGSMIDLVTHSKMQPSQTDRDSRVRQFDRGKHSVANTW